MRINHNISALNTYHRLHSNNLQTAKSIEKLSTGHRINRSGDDAAGLAISEKMRGQIRGLNMAVKNGQNGISMIQTVEGALQETHSILQRIRELSVQSATDTVTHSDRSKLQKEVSQLKEEIDRISSTTEFNTIKVLDAGSTLHGVDQSVIDTLKQNIPLWIDDALSAINTNLGIDLPLSSRDMTITLYQNAAETRAAYMATSDGGASLELGLNLSKLLDSNNQIPSGTSGGQFDTVIAHEIVHALQFTEMSSVLANGVDTWFIEGLATAVQGGNGFLSSMTNSTASVSSSWSGDYGSAFAAVKTLHEITVGGINAIVDRLELGDTLDQAIANTTQQIQGEFSSGVSDFTTVADFTNWFNTSTDVDTYLDNSTDFSSGTGAIHAGGTAGSSFTGTQENTIANDTNMDNTGIYNFVFADVSAGKIQTFSFHIGANEGQAIAVDSVDGSATGLGIAMVDVTNRGNAEEALSAVELAVETVSNIRSRFGAIQNRLEHTINNLAAASENLTAAESRIRDVDMAQEMMEFTKGNILSQAAQAMLAQANQQPQGVLQLLR
jgi:flagellin